MRAPEQRQRYPPRSDDRLQPEAFTILPPEERGYLPPPEPPSAPQPYRLTPTSRRHKNMSFSILAEGGSRSGSRSPSPTGRVSPFRGRGFNPAGSRHASPAPSPPPPEEHKHSSTLPQHSKIPKLSRRGSATVFGEKVEDFRTSPNKRKLNPQLSQSLSEISSKKVSNRPPPSPRRHQQQRDSTKNHPAFQRLSPIVGSSPEPSQSQSSPSNKSRSQPQSRFSSPSRRNNNNFVNTKPPPGNYPNHNNSRPASRNPSRRTSREPSPNKNPTSPTKIPVKHNFKNVQAKVNSFNKAKPKVPPKPDVLSSDENANKTKVDQKESENRLRTNSRINLNNNNNNNTNNSKINPTKDSNGNTLKNKAASKVNKNSSNTKTDDKNKKSDDDKKGGIISETKKNVETAKKVAETPVKLLDLLQPSATTVVSSTTTTVTQPLKIDAKLENTATINESAPTKTRLESKTISPMVDGRVLSATSVSHAMNKMNDTVLDTQALIKEHGLTKLSPAASAIIAMSSESNKTNSTTNNPNRNALAAADTKKVTTASPTVDAVGGNTLINKNNSLNSNNTSGNHVSTTGLMSARALEDHVQNNMSKLISPDHDDHVMGNSVQKNVNDRIREARTVVANDVKPIKIMVKEKPMGVEVQSGNIRFDAPNGLSERPGLPPTQNATNNDPPPESQEPPNKSNGCTRFMSSCREKITCYGNKNNDEMKRSMDEQNEVEPGCFSCCRQKKSDVTINIEDDDDVQPKCWDKFKCCGRNKVKDTDSQRRDSWKDRSDSILSDTPLENMSCGCCGGIFRRLFCLDMCRKKPKPVIENKASRRTSMMSKKKSLTPSVHPEEQVPKLDMSLVEHTSAMKGAIPVLPMSLAWFCLVMNCLAPGTGTIFSGMFCLCLGIPRFSQKDGAKQRFGAFLIDLIIGIGQCFTVLFCLVGWGWSIWWGVIMIKVAKKHKKIKAIEGQDQGIEQSSVRVSQIGNENQNNRSRDPGRGS